MSVPATRVLLIEDDVADHQLIKRSLGKARCVHELVWAKSLRDGLLKLSEGGFSAVLTDLSLPDSFGLKTVERIRKHDLNIPIIVLTTLDDDAVELDTLRIGAQDYVKKDEATPHALDRAIHHAIQRQESIVETQRLREEVESSRELLCEQSELLRMTDLLKQKNKRLRRLYRTANRFVDNVSHEFRTPLTVIKDYISLVREGMVGDVNPEQCELLDIAGVRADELNNMVDDMLDVSKLESGLLGVWRRPCRLADIVESVCPSLARKSAVKGIKFHVEVPENLPAVYCDSEKVGRVIINLVTNAMKFCGDPGEVRLRARVEPARGEVVVEVADDGPGIEKQALTAIFKRFKQLKTTCKSGTKGFGLGLNIAKELVDLNFGDMTVESELGKGAVFAFTIPLDDPQGVMQRYLKRHRALRHSGTTVALLHARIDEQISAADAEDSDSFFNFLLRRNDLIFRAGPHDWLFVLPIPRVEVADFLTRARNEWKKTNRNRPFGPLPHYAMTVEGVWNAEEESADLLSRFTEFMRAGEATGSWGIGVGKGEGGVRG